MQHLRYCVEVERDEPAKRRRFSNERPRTRLRPDFMLQRLRPDDYEDTFRAGMLESRPTIDEMRHHKHTSSDPRSRECYTYSREDQSRWELYDSDENEFARNNSVLPDCDIPVSKAPYQKNNSALPDNFMFQSKLANIMQRHKTDMKVFDEVVDLVNDYTQTGRLSMDTPPLTHREAFLLAIEKQFESTPMKPNHINVQLEDGQSATVSLFDVEAMILSLTMNGDLMDKSNIADGYDIFTGGVDPNHESYNLFGEVHTGEAWEKALKLFCGPDGQFMPISLIIFGDKTHTDLHGALLVTPIIFTLTCFNRTARNKPEFWRPLAYIPNLCHGKSKADDKNLLRNLRNEHTCLAAAFQPIIDLHLRDGISSKVRGVDVIGKIWIHFFIGDTQGNNSWLCHYNSSGKLQSPYRDCACNFLDMNATNPKCKSYVDIFGKCDFH